MAKLRTVAHQLASLSPEDRKVAMQLASDLTGTKTRKKRRAKRQKPGPKPKAVRESKPRLPKAPGRVRAVKPLATGLDDDE